MQITELKHLTTCIDLNNGNQCIDGKHHLFVFSLKTGNEGFEVFYKNEDMPYKVKQVAGVSRRVTDEEFSRLNTLCRIRLNQEVNNNLVLIPEYVHIAKIIASELQATEFEDFLEVAAKLYASTNENDAYFQLSEMFLWEMELVEMDDDETDALIDSIIHKLRGSDQPSEWNKYFRKWI